MLIVSPYKFFIQVIVFVFNNRGNTFYKKPLILRSSAN